jgi:hypothetical protein
MKGTSRSHTYSDIQLLLTCIFYQRTERERGAKKKITEIHGGYCESHTISLRMGREGFIGEGYAVCLQKKVINH